jgi:hypothetical protein
MRGLYAPDVERELPSPEHKDYRAGPSAAGSVEIPGQAEKPLKTSGAPIRSRRLRRRGQNRGAAACPVPEPSS